jgi:deoxycytidine triphosphate deaminase
MLTVSDILADRDLMRLLNKCLLQGHQDFVKANTYELRLGGKARFRNTDERVSLVAGEYLEVGPGETVDLTSLEVIDFRSDTVTEIFPGKALMGLLTNRTTLMREGISFPATKIDPGFYGTLDWVFKNHEFQAVILPYGEPLVNLVVFQLSAGERPDFQYGHRSSDYYQGSSGLKASGRQLPAQIPDGLIKRQTRRPADAAKRIHEYGPPLSWVGDELDTITRQFQLLKTEVEGFIPKMEQAITARFNKAYAYMAALGGLLVALIQILRDAEAAWIPWLIGGLSLILLLLVLVVGRAGPKA